MNIAVMKETKPPTVISFAVDWDVASSTISESAMAATSCAAGTLAAAAFVCFMRNRRTRSASSLKRPAS